MIVLLLCLTVGAVAGMVLLLQPQSRTAGPDSREPSAANASDASQAGGAGPVTPTQVKVGCQAPDATDGAGRPVSYVPEQLIDAKLNTAWRCNGNGIGQVLAFTLPAGTSIAEVGLVNGYAKVDPASGARRYGEYRRITAGDLDLCQWHELPAVADGRGEDTAEAEHPCPGGRHRHAHHQCQHPARIKIQRP